MSIKVVDLQNEEVKEEPPAIEEVKQEAEQPELTNEIIEAPTEEPKEEPKEEVKEEEEPKPKQLSQGESSLGQSPKPIRAQDRIITCPKCNKSMKMKSYRYSHEQNCKGNLSERPVKKHTKA